MNQTFNKIRDFIKDDELKEALELLESYAIEQNDQELNKNAISQLGRLTQTEKNYYQKGILSQEQYKIERANIRFAILQLTDINEHRTSVNKNSSHTKKRGYQSNRIQIIVAAIGAIGAIIVAIINIWPEILQSDSTIQSYTFEGKAFYEDKNSYISDAKIDLREYTIQSTKTDAYGNFVIRNVRLAKYENLIHLGIRPKGQEGFTYVIIQFDFPKNKRHISLGQVLFPIDATD